MKVTDISDADLALIGNQNTKEFKISNSASFFNILSANLYSNPILAIVREVLCNAWDAHVQAKIERPIEVTLSETELVIKDFGLGIPDSRIVEIYGTYGASTKVGEVDQTGGFGLGCKSPFAYTDHFEVTSINQGTKTIYQMIKSSEDNEGKPAICKILSVKASEDEQGLTVRIPLINASDVDAFNNALQRVTTYAEKDTILNGQVQSHCPAFDRYLVLSNFGRSFSHDSRILIKYGDVVYPLSEKQEEYRKVFNKLYCLIGNMNFCHTKSLALVIKAPANSISLSPSRESLRYTESNIKVFTKLLTDTWLNIDRNWKVKWSSFIKEYVKERKNNFLLDWSLTEFRDNAKYFKRSEDYYDESNLYSRIGAFGTHTHLTQEIIKHLLEGTPWSSSLVNAYKKELSSVGKVGYTPHINLRKWYESHYLSNLKKNMEEKSLKTSRLSIAGYTKNNNYKIATTQVNKVNWQINPSTVLHTLIPIVYVGTSLTKQDEAGNTIPKELLYYRVTPKEDIDSVCDTWKELGFKTVQLAKPAYKAKSDATSSSLEFIHITTLDRGWRHANCPFSWSEFVDTFHTINPQTYNYSSFKAVCAITAKNNFIGGSSIPRCLERTISRWFCKDILVVSTKKELNYVLKSTNLISVEEYLKNKLGELSKKALDYYPNINDFADTQFKKQGEGIYNFIDYCRRSKKSFNYSFIEKLIKAPFNPAKDYQILGKALGINFEVRMEPSYKKFLKDCTQNNLSYCPQLYQKKTDEDFINKHLLKRN